MQTTVETWNAISQTWAERMLAVVWQSTVLAVVVALVAALLLRRSSPAVRHWVWQIVAIKLLVMPFWSWAIPWRGPTFSESPFVASLPDHADDREGSREENSGSDEATQVDTSSLRSDSAAAKLQSETTQRKSVQSGASQSKSSRKMATPLPLHGLTWQSWLLLAYAVVVVAQGFRLLVQRRRLAQLLKDAVPADAELAQLVASAAERLGVRRTPATLIVRSDFSPFVCGIRRPQLILPSGLSQKLTLAELDQVLLHELAHIRRHDLVWSWIGEIARIAYFFHPVAHWINYQSRLQRELACDQMAMAVSGHGANEYAATLVQVVSLASEPSVFRTAASAGFDGERR